MANIVEELGDILQAIKGEEVRQSIYRSLVSVNLQTEKLEDVVGALNDAITAETSTNVRSFVETVEEKLSRLEEGYSPEDGAIEISNYTDDSFLTPMQMAIPDIPSSAIMDFTLDLPKAFKPSENGYTISIARLWLGRTNFLSGSVTGLNNIVVVTNSTLADHVISCEARNTLGGNKMHFKIVFDTSYNFTSTLGTTCVLSLIFSLTENEPET